MMNRLYICSTLLLSAAVFLFGQDTCLECHGEPDLYGETASGKEISVFVDAKEYAQSVHADFSCTDCHVDAEGDPHELDLQKVDCGECHTMTTDRFSNGLHAQLDEPLQCRTCHTAHAILPASNKQSPTHPLNEVATCGECHLRETGDAGGHLDAYSYFQSVHHQAILNGNPEAASCSDCHESHLTLKKSDPRSPINGMNISTTCGSCHQETFDDYQISIHARALDGGEYGVPTCVTCHSAHGILSAQNPESDTHVLHAADEICAPCHGVARLNQRFGMAGNIVDSYYSSYHGLAVKNGSRVAANCNSCHGVHDIRSHENPDSRVHSDNLQTTCGNCHPNATAQFAASFLHGQPQSTGDRLSAIIRTIYLILISVIIGGMLLHNGIIYAGAVRRKLQEQRRHTTVERFDTAARVQHLLLLITFIILAVTGFALRSPQAGWVQLLGSLGLSESLRGLLHRIAAVGLVLTGMYHLGAVLFRKSWRGAARRMLPTAEDFRHLLQNLRRHLGNGPRPQFNKYGYVEKFEYWCVVWGTVIMAVTGFVLWFPNAATALLPGWAISVAQTIHFYEAVLAVGAIIVFHLFFVILHPDEHPLNLSIFTGAQPKHEAETKHPQWRGNTNEPIE